MNTERLRRISVWFYAVFFFLISGLVLFLFNVISLSHGGKVLITLLSFLSLYFAGTFKCLCIDDAILKQKEFYKTVCYLFALYIMFIVDFTLLDDSLGRNIFNIFTWDSASFKNYIGENVNLVPFATVKLFINAYRNGILNFLPVFENLLGNLCVFMPFAFFVPLIFKRVNRWYKFLLVIVIAVLLVEILQFLFLTGSSDVDDLILNVGGAMAAYGFIRNKKIKKILSKITFGVLSYE